MWIFEIFFCLYYFSTLKTSHRACFCIEESLSLKSFSMNSLCLYLFFMIVSAKAPLLQRYIAENGSNVARFAKAAVSAHNISYAVRVDRKI